MDVDPWFWAYAALYKLATIGAGVVAISFGFRLFKLRVRASGNATVTLGDYQLQSNTTAPGTFFALFGASIIGIMIYQGTPSYEQTSEAVRVTKGPEPIAPAAGRPDRVETQVGFLAAYQRGVELRKEGDDNDPPPSKWSALRYAFGSKEDGSDGKEETQAGRDRREVAAG
jgi:hypothetical protein